MTSVVIQVPVADLAERPKAGHTIAVGKKRYRLDLEPAGNAGMWEFNNLTYVGPSSE